jgi:hypothetical protein
MKGKPLFMIKYIYTTLIVLFTASHSFAQTRSIFPLPHEVLDSPIVLECGLIIREFSGNKLDKRTINRLNKHCNIAHKYFFLYNHMEKPYDFSWNISFIPEGTCHRCLNDRKDRFKDIFIKNNNIIGYTDLKAKYIFMYSKTDRYWDLTFVHELFHAMSMYYDIYDNYPCNQASPQEKYTCKTEYDEYHAQQFTEILGYGR